MTDTLYDNIDSLIRDLYDSICGPAGQERKWDQLRALFFPGAHLVPVKTADDGAPVAIVVDVAGYIKRTADYFQENGFCEWEIARRTDVFGHIAHVLSTYEARHATDDPAPFKRGVNGIQLFHDGQRWWIINMLWDDERPDNPLPAKYLASE